MRAEKYNQLYHIEFCNKRQSLEVLTSKSVKYRRRLFPTRYYRLVEQLTNTWGPRAIRLERILKKLESWKQPEWTTLTYRRHDMARAMDACSDWRLSESYFIFKIQDKSLPQLLSSFWNPRAFSMIISQSDIAKLKWKYTLKRKHLISHIKLFPLLISYTTFKTADNTYTFTKKLSLHILYEA